MRIVDTYDRFMKLGPQLSFNGKVLKLAKVQNRDSGLYECIARNGVDEDLRKVIQVRVRGKYPSNGRTRVSSSAR